MSSLKMTFSLASLVLILGLVFVAAPAMAQDITVQRFRRMNADCCAHGFGVVADHGARLVMREKVKFT